ncbi:hypothetical protein DPEC_G00182630 [Dallia pectoralis]|uniref:Uncharacterized protein n=1 Tax=Dallia pectoralis TaxID=75939 RepID=A0ACC2GAP1_DALPE|nr:hypothetical protein DPEC_G00182630 [Dallia pectoralis]
MADEGTPGHGRPAGHGEGTTTGTVAALNPQVPIRGIKMKFAVLAGLVEVGEVSNRDIVETLFNLIFLSSVYLIRPHLCYRTGASRISVTNKEFAVA